MTLSRRSFFSGLAVALAAPAIVKAEGLMRLAPTEILRPDVSLQLISSYNPLEMPVTRLDVLYGTMRVRPEWIVVANGEPALTLDTYAERILSPMIDKLTKQWQKNITEMIFNNNAGIEGLFGPTPSIE